MATVLEGVTLLRAMIAVEDAVVAAPVTTQEGRCGIPTLAEITLELGVGLEVSYRVVLELLLVTSLEGAMRALVQRKVYLQVLFVLLPLVKTPVAVAAGENLRHLQLLDAQLCLAAHQQLMFLVLAFLLLPLLLVHLPFRRLTSKTLSSLLVTWHQLVWLVNISAALMFFTVWCRASSQCVLRERVRQLWRRRVAGA